MESEDLFLVQLDEVPRAGWTVDSVLPESWLACALAPAYSPGGKTAAIRFVAHREHDRLTVVGHVSATVRFECSRCAEDVERTLDIDVKALFVPQGRLRIQAADVGVLADEPEGMYEYSSRSISVEQPFMEAVVFRLEHYPQCRSDCAGLCPRCGTNLNVEACDCSQSHTGESPAALAGWKEKLAGKRK